MIEIDDEQPPQPVTITLTLPEAVFYSARYTVNAGLESIREKLRDLDSVYKDIPSNPTPDDLPICADVVIDRDALWRVICYYKDREREAEAFIEALALR